MSAIEFCIDTVRLADEMPEKADQAQAELVALKVVAEKARELTDRATRRQDAVDGLPFSLRSAIHQLTEAVRNYEALK